MKIDEDQCLICGLAEDVGEYYVGVLLAYHSGDLDTALPVCATCFDNGLFQTWLQAEIDTPLELIEINQRIRQNPIGTFRIDDDSGDKEN